jgi:hypothetical protein
MYTLRVTSSGFTPESFEAVQLQVGDTRSVRVVMRVQGVEATVTVESVGRRGTPSQSTVVDAELVELQPELLGPFNVIGCVVPQEELVPCLVEKLFTELLDGVREERRHENPFGRPQLYPLTVFFGPSSKKTTVFELAPTTARALLVATR